ncbi:MAG TPA: RDD family protein [Candidatus Nanopelagicales bacterium]|nr:RDD family protein [Candidatus Nanopelagicales bacterium]
MESTGAPGTPPPDEAPVLQEAAPPPPPPPPPPAEPALPPAAGAPVTAAASTSPAWLSNVTSSQTLAGPAGLVYADIPSRIFAYIIDAIILSVGFFILFTIFAGLFFSSLLLGGFGFMSFVWLVVLLVVYAAGSAIYFIYTWTKLRGSPGQRVLGLETLNAADGAVLTQAQAIRRWLFLFGPSVVATVLSLTSFLGGIGTLLGLLIWAYSIYLLYTAANSATRQGFHDVQANTVVIKIKK